ncbi:MAG TPA: NAD(P)H-binding protein [Puia sp.]|nr:NAD(P)H-binding protein [Puia sp.]
MKLEGCPQAAYLIESSTLDYIILFPGWFTSNDEVDYKATKKDEPEKGSVISQKSLAAFIAKVIESPERYRCANLGINKPNT